MKPLFHLFYQYIYLDRFTAGYIDIIYLSNRSIYKNINLYFISLPVYLGNLFIHNIIDKIITYFDYF